jgi:hypothetical protein
MLSKYKVARQDFLHVCKARPTDRDARAKLAECDKQIKRIAFEEAIAVDDSKPASEQIDIETIRTCWLCMQRSTCEVLWSQRCGVLGRVSGAGRVQGPAHWRRGRDAGLRHGCRGGVPQPAPHPQEVCGADSARGEAHLRRHGVADGGTSRGSRCPRLLLCRHALRLYLPLACELAAGGVCCRSRCRRKPTVPLGSRRGSLCAAIRTDSTMTSSTSSPSTDTRVPKTRTSSMARTVLALLSSSSFLPHLPAPRCWC